MKNIHIIPTDKPSTPSRLFYKEQELVFSKKYSVFNGVNIYITSDEEIKVNDYITDGYSVWQWKDDSSLLGRKKVILATDQDLINNGVQAIHDEFLEWFVKNPSCQYGGYKDIDWDKIITQKEEPKQETLEEAASKLLYNKYPYHPPQDSGYWIDMFIEGYKLAQEQDKNKYSEEEAIENRIRGINVDTGFKQERMYSEEDLKEAFMAGIRKSHSPKKHSECWGEWFEQFKKK
jgi:hypothetical protein